MDRMVNIICSGYCMNGGVIEKTKRAISVETKNCVKSEERAKMAVRMTLHKQNRHAIFVPERSLEGVDEWSGSKTNKNWLMHTSRCLDI